MDLSGESLKEIRRRIETAASEAAVLQLVTALRGDRRRGARSLADGVERRLRAERRERQRLEQLFALRHRLLSAGARAVAGVDEVGVGPLAGPVVACAVVLPERVYLPGLNDSKRLTPAARERLDVQIREQALALGLGSLSPQEVDELNVHRASLEAMRRAVMQLEVAPDHVLVDARTIPGLKAPQTALVHGDAVDGSIAAASIVAKVHRDALMVQLHERYPGYGFAQHKGYPTPDHLEALRRLGPSPEHRRSFAPVAALL
jgi:ribonuclease HII